MYAETALRTKNKTYKIKLLSVEFLFRTYLEDKYAVNLLD